MPHFLKYIQVKNKNKKECGALKFQHNKTNKLHTHTFIQNEQKYIFSQSRILIKSI